MTRPYSQDLRERALARFEAGETVRSIGKTLGIDPSCVPKWVKRRRETGSVAPAAIGGCKPRTLSGDIAYGCVSVFTPAGSRRGVWRPNLQSAPSRRIGARFGLSSARKG